MRVVYTLILTLALAAPVAAQSLTVPVVGGTLFTPVSDGANVGDEPNVASGGRFAMRYAHSPDGYPADSNGIADARKGLAPVRILEMRPTTSSSLDGFSETQVPWLLTPFIGQDYVDPQNEYRAVFGDWADYNGDGVIQNDQWEDEDITKDPAVRGNAFAGATGDEWAGVGVADFEDGWTLVTYQTGFVNHENDDGGLIAGNNGLLLGQADGFDPSNTYRGDNGDGYYVSLIGVGLGRSTLDVQLVNTVVSETFIGELAVGSGERKYAPVEGQPYDVDVYKALDPSVQALYIGTLVAVGNADNTANNTANEADEATNNTLAPIFAAVDEATQPVFDIVDGLGLPDTDAMINPVVGGAVVAVFPTFAAEQQDAETNPGIDYTSGWHPWVDVKNNYGVIASDVFGLGLSTFEVSPTANGERGVAPGMLFPRISHGLWNDANADGFITDHVSGSNPEEPAAGCPDLNDCGLGGNEMTTDHVEWTGACPNLSPKVRYNSLAPGGRWGSGVYVVKDLGTAFDDAVDNAEIDRLVTEGEIELSATCNADNSPYQSFADEAILFPAGNPDFDVKADTRYCTSFDVSNVRVTECTTDVDILRAYAE